MKAGYDYTNELVRIPWKSPVDYSLIEKIIKYNKRVLSRNKILIEAGKPVLKEL